MADYVAPQGHPVTLYLGNGNFHGQAAINATTITDNDSLSSDFTVGESLSIPGINTGNATFEGTFSFGGQDYPVVQFIGSPDFYYVIGIQLDSGDFPTIASLGLSSGAFTVCYAEGTLIGCPDGEVPVEQLKIGDLVDTADGESVPVKWIGRQTVSTRFGPAERLMPVRFAAGSLGDGLPHMDLTVTADHGMLVDGIICHAGALVNGTSITRVPLAEMGDTYTVYHIETEAHEIILANGAPAETFIDNVSRRVFDNYTEFEALYGEVPEMVELPYPRAMSARQVPGRVAVRLGRSRTALC